MSSIDEFDVIPYLPLKEISASGSLLIKSELGFTGLKRSLDWDATMFGINSKFFPGLIFLIPVNVPH